MVFHDAIAEQIESPGETFDEDAVGEAFQIRKVLHRAYEIHRARGGLFGYDLEDWLQAERELAAEAPRNKSRSRAP